MFAEAVSAIDAGDLGGLRALLSAHPELLTERLENGRDDYFARPYLLWFVAENPIRNGTLPANIVAVTRATPEERQVALAGAALHGRADALRELIAAGIDLDAFNPPVWHSHSTALHSAVVSGSAEAVQVLIDAGADRTIRDTLFDGTADDWTRYLNPT